MPSKVITYLLWVFFGLFGFHHFYLRRYRHCLVWLCTFGGFGYGWLRDFVRLPTYIQEAREDEKELEKEKEKEKKEKEKEEKEKNGMKSKKEKKEEAVTEAMKKKERDKQLKSSWTRSTGQVTFAVLLDVTFRSAIPEEILENNYWLHHVVNLAAAVLTAIGIHIVGNIGRHNLSFKWCIWPSILGHIVFPAESSMALYGIVGATIVADWKGKEAKHRKRKTSRLKAMTAISFAFAIFLAMWGSGLWFNTYITTNDGERVRLKDAVVNFFNSPAWTEMLDTLVHLYNFVKYRGFADIYREFIIALDPEGETNAYKVLNLDSSSSAAEIKASCRRLSRLHHPDKARGEEAKKLAEQRFIEVQGACQVLDKLRARRIKNSKASVEL